MKRPPPKSTPSPYPTLFRSLIGNEPFAPVTWSGLLDVPISVPAWFRRLVWTARLFVSRTAAAFPGLSAVGGGSSKQDRKGTRLNSSHSQNSYAVFCLQKKNLIRRPGTDELRSHASTTQLFQADDPTRPPPRRHRHQRADTVRPTHTALSLDNAPASRL